MRVVHRPESRLCSSTFTNLSSATGQRLYTIRVKLFAEQLCAHTGMLQSSCKPLLTTSGVHGLPALVPARRPGRRRLRCCNAQPAGFGPAVTLSGRQSPGLKEQYVVSCEIRHGAGGSTGTYVLPHKPDLQGKDVRANWNAVALAFLGDSVWEVFCVKNC